MKFLISQIKHIKLHYIVSDKQFSSREVKMMKFFYII